MVSLSKNKRNYLFSFVDFVVGRHFKNSFVVYVFWFRCCFHITTFDFSVKSFLVFLVVELIDDVLVLRSKTSEMWMIGQREQDDRRTTEVFNKIHSPKQNKNHKKKVEENKIRWKFEMEKKITKKLKCFSFCWKCFVLFFLSQKKYSNGHVVRARNNVYCAPVTFGLYSFDFLDYFCCSFIALFYYIFDSMKKKSLWFSFNSNIFLYFARLFIFCCLLFKWTGLFIFIDLK